MFYKERNILKSKPIYSGPSKIKNWDRKFKCVFCFKLFDHKSEFGKLNCEYHPGRINYSNGKFSCCGKGKFEKGCKKRCHSDEHRDWYIITHGERKFLQDNKQINLKLHKDCNKVMGMLDKEHVKMSKERRCCCIVLNTGKDPKVILNRYKRFLRENFEYEKQLQLHEDISI